MNPLEKTFMPAKVAHEGEAGRRDFAIRREQRAMKLRLARKRRHGRSFCVVVKSRAMKPLLFACKQHQEGARAEKRCNKSGNMWSRCVPQPRSSRFARPKRSESSHRRARTAQ